jgi:hypothetical protein
MESSPGDIVAIDYEKHPGSIRDHAPGGEVPWASARGLCTQHGRDAFTTICCQGTGGTPITSSSPSSDARGAALTQETT